MPEPRRRVQGSSSGLPVRPLWSHLLGMSGLGVGAASLTAGAVGSVSSGDWVAPWQANRIITMVIDAHVNIFDTYRLFRCLFVA